LISRFRNLLRRDHAAPLAAVQLGVLAFMSGGLALAAVPAAQGENLARIIGGDFGAQAFARLTGRMDPAMLSLAGRFDPKVQPMALRPALDDGSLEMAQTVGEAEAGLIRLQDLSPDAARAWNAAQPISTLANPPAQPFFLATEGVMDEARALDCMTAAVYYEAAYESTDGQRAVAQVVLNRMRHPAYPKTVCGVVFQGSTRTTGCQFTFTCDGSLAREPNPEIWARTRKVAEAALNGYVMKKVGNATHYHASYVAPYWSPSLLKVANVGAHIFYRWMGGAGMPPAFGGRYAGGEGAGLQLATLDKLSKGPGKVVLASAQHAAEAAAPEAVDVAEAAAPAVEAAKDSEIVTAPAAMAQGEMLKPEELDWQGRPRQKTAPRIAIPGAGPKF